MKFLELLKTLTLTTIVTVASQSPFFQQNKVLAQSTSPVIQYAYSANHYGYYGNISSSLFQGYITDVVKQGGYVTNIAFTPQGGFVIVYTVPSQDYPTQYKFHYYNIPTEAYNELNFLVSQPYGLITDIKFAPKGGFVILHDDNEIYISSDTPSALVNDIKAVQKQASNYPEIYQVLFPPQGGVALIADGYTFIYSSDVPAAIGQQFTAIAKIGQIVNSIAFTPQGGLVATLNSLSTPVYYYGNIPQTLVNEIQQLRSTHSVFHVTWITFDPNSDWALYDYFAVLGSGPIQP